MYVSVVYILVYLCVCVCMSVCTKKWDMCTLRLLPQKKLFILILYITEVSVTEIQFTIENSNVAQP